jgi:hypothetical protein
MCLSLFLNFELIDPKIVIINTPWGYDWSRPPNSLGLCYINVKHLHQICYLFFLSFFLSQKAMSGNAEHVWHSGVQLQCVAARKPSYFWTSWADTQRMRFCYTLLHAGAATHLNICDSLPYYQPNTLAGAINNFFIVYPQKYENCSTLAVRLFMHCIFWGLIWDLDLGG